MILDAFHAPANDAHVLFHDVLGALDVNELFVVREQQRGMLLLRFGDGLYRTKNLDHGRFEHANAAVQGINALIQGIEPVIDRIELAINRIETPLRLLTELRHLLPKLVRLCAHLLQQPDRVTFDVAVIAHNSILPPPIAKLKQHIMPRE